MNRPITVEEYIDKNISFISLNSLGSKSQVLEFANEVIRVDREYCSYIRQKCCNVCGSELMGNEIFAQQPDWFNVVCQNHLYFAKVFNIELAKQRHPDKV